MRFKELCLVKQGLSKLKVEEARKDFNLKEIEIAYTLAVNPLDNPAYLLPLTNSLIFSSFLILPNLFFLVLLYFSYSLL